MCEKKTSQENCNTWEKLKLENFPGQIMLIITFPTYLFINLFCFKFLVANEFFSNFEIKFSIEFLNFEIKLHY